MANLTLLVLSHFVRVRVSEHCTQLQRDSTELIWSKLSSVLLFHGGEQVLYDCIKRSDQCPARRQSGRKDNIRLLVSSSMTNFWAVNFWRVSWWMGERSCSRFFGTSNQALAGRGNFFVLIARKKTFPSHSILPFALGKTLCFEMVVVNSEPSTSAPKRKNRRSMHKKKSSAVPGAAVEKIGVEVDQEMEPVDQEVYVPEPPTTTSTADPVAEGVDQDQPADLWADDEVMIDTDISATTGIAPTSAPSFPALTGSALQASLKSEMRRIPIPPHRMSPLKKDWINMFGPLTEILGLQVRMNVQRKAVEIRVSVQHSTLAFSIPTHVSVIRHQNTRKRSAHSRKVQISLKLTHSGST